MPPMPVLAGVAVVLLAGAGVMTYLGWLPTHSAPGTSVVHSTRPELTGATVPCGRCGRVEAVREISSGHGVSNRTLYWSDASPAFRGLQQRHERTRPFG